MLGCFRARLHDNWMNDERRFAESGYNSKSSLLNQLAWSTFVHRCHRFRSIVLERSCQSWGHSMQISFGTCFPCWQSRLQRLSMAIRISLSGPWGGHSSAISAFPASRRRSSPRLRFVASGRGRKVVWVQGRGRRRRSLVVPEIHVFSTESVDLYGVAGQRTASLFPRGTSGSARGPRSIRSITSSQ